MPKHRMTTVNAAQIIEHSQAVPFKCRQSTFLCFYCALEFTDPDLLKAHTRTHRATAKDIVYAMNTKQDLVKADVTCLDCKICGVAISELVTLRTHLVQEHGKRFADDVSDGILPYKLSDNYCCVLCAKRFPFFHMLNVHMNVHFYSYVCEVCGKGFATRQRLTSHSELHVLVDEPCHLCGKVFKNRQRLKLHIQLIHERKGNQVCRKCPQRFIDYHQKMKHLLEVHNEKPLSFPCKSCSRVFTKRRNLTNHTKRDHLMLRNFECAYCNKKFYGSSSLKNHLATHSKERNFKCTDCGHSYTTKKVLRDHIKRLHFTQKSAATN